MNEPTTLNNNITQVGAYTLSTGTGAISLNGNVTLSANNTFTQNGTGTFSTGTGANTLNGNTEVSGSNTFKVGTGLTTLGGDLTVTGTAWTATPTISGLLTTTSGLTSNGTVTIQNNSNFIQSGTGTFSTGTGTISLNGNTTITGNNTFQVGTNGSSMTILSGGNTGIGSTNPRTKLELGGDGSFLATGSYGSGWTEPNLGSGTRMFWYPSKASFRAGSVDSTQWNDINIGSYSTATNKNTTARGDNSNATNDNTTASSYDSTAIGRWNVGGGTATSWVSTDPLFEVGNGADSSNKANALTVLKNGNVQVQGSITGVGVNSGSGLIEGSGGLTITGTISLPNSSITNANLANSTISGISLGSNLSTLTFGTHLTGTSYNGSTAATIATDATDANTVSTIVSRDASGNFSAGTITATLTGHSSLDLPLTGGTMTGGITNSTSSNPLTTLAESWIGPSSTAGIYFKGGNVGVGTTEPQNPLDVGDGALSTVTGKFMVVTSISTNSGLALGQSMTARGRLRWNYNVTESNSYLSLGDALGTHALSLQDAGGNVGIGTT
ncbi:MAG: hypothetical protein NTV03_01570, partial [Candidatus Nomurabacteria bacterium]|nr:hypothetical protein [Candidatus Nomurabacteria bacterium]